MTPAELREVERGFMLMLRRRFSAVWIAENAKDVIAQANIEYVEWLKDNPPARNPVGWLLTCAYRRAQNLLDSQTRRPPTASLDAVDAAFRLADESTPTPEQQALDHDRHERLRNALRHLPDKERKLLALIYFEDHSIREAGRKVGWQKSAADRHHNWALEKLRALVGDDRNLLSPATLGLAAWVVAKGEGHRAILVLDAAFTPGREVVAIGTESATVAVHRGAELWRRLSPVTDPSNAAATSGGGRVIGACGVMLATVVCGLAASGVVPWVGGGVNAAPQPAKLRQPNVTRQVSAPTPVLPTQGLPKSEQPAPRHPEHAEPATVEATAPVQPKPRRPRTEPAPPATVKKTINEFGVEKGSVPETAPAPAHESSESSVSSGSSPSLSGSSGSSSGSSGGPEFGL